MENRDWPQAKGIVLPKFGITENVHRMMKDQVEDESDDYEDIEEEREWHERRSKDFPYLVALCVGQGTGDSDCAITPVRSF